MRPWYAVAFGNIAKRNVLIVSVVSYLYQTVDRSGGAYVAAAAIDKIRGHSRKLLALSWRGEGVADL
jgi:hypothetical protein